MFLVTYYSNPFERWLPTADGLQSCTTRDRYQQSAKPPTFKVAKLWLGCDGLAQLDWPADGCTQLATPKLIPTCFWESSCSGSIFNFWGVQLKINSFKWFVIGKSIWFELLWPFTQWWFSRFAWETWIRVQVLHYQYISIPSSVTFRSPASFDCNRGLLWSSEPPLTNTKKLLGQTKKLRTWWLKRRNPNLYTPIRGYEVQAYILLASKRRS